MVPAVPVFSVTVNAVLLLAPAASPLKLPPATKPAESEVSVASKLLRVASRCGVADGERPLGGSAGMHIAASLPNATGSGACSDALPAFS